VKQQQKWQKIDDHADFFLSQLRYYTHEDDERDDTLVELVAAATVEPGVAIEDGNDDVKFVAKVASAVEELAVIAVVDAKAAEVVDNVHVDHFENIEVEISD
jgi:hypothetical protein